MRRTTWAGALRPIPILAALGAALAGCGGDLGPSRYGGGYYGGGGGSFRQENRAQESLRQYWMDRSRQVR